MAQSKKPAVVQAGGVELLTVTRNGRPRYEVRDAGDGWTLVAYGPKADTIASAVTLAVALTGRMVPNPAAASADGEGDEAEASPAIIEGQ